MKGTLKQGTTMKQATINTTQPREEDETPRMPHERDESDDSQVSEPRKVMQQAHDDIASGMVDTDCRNQSSAEGEDAAQSICSVPEKKSGDR